MTNIEKVKQLTKEQLIILLTQHKTNKGILISLGISSTDPRILKELNNLYVLYRVDKPTVRRMLYTDQDIIEAVQKSNCLSDVLTKIGLTKHGNNFKTIRSNINRLNLDISHLSREKGNLINRNQTVWTKENVFVVNSNVGRGNLRSYVLKHKVLIPYACECCSNTGSWNDKELKLTIDHINGINNDNRMENLRWLCPNCHSQTETFGTQKKHK